MESLFDILSNRIPDEPPEIRIVKGYVRQHFQAEVNVQSRDKEIVVIVQSSALAGALRARTADINKQLGRPGKRLVFRIGRVG